MSSGESIISAVYSNTSLASLDWEVDPLELRGISSSVKPLEGAVMNESWLRAVEAAVEGGRGPEGTRCCKRSRELLGGSLPLIGLLRY